MRGLTVNVAIATAVFVVLSLLWRGTDDLSATVFGAIVFALAYGAIRVAILIFKGDRQ